MAESANVSMDLLLSSLDDNKNISSVKRKLTDLDKGAAAPKFVNKVVSDRAERAVTYDATSKEVGRWQELVTTNRHASTLDIANDKRIVPSARSLIKKFEPRTDLENEVQMILVKSNTHSDEAISKQEVDELGERNLTAEEIKERQAELGKVKSLLFYQQLKQHRVNKIKSKSFHRIKKRQRLRREEATKDLMMQCEDADAMKQVEEDEQYQRVKERMNLKHKNTGKWAKMALVHGKHDKNLRAAYHESVRQGNDLLKKMSDAPGRGGEGSDLSDGDSGGEGGKSWSDEEEEGSSTAAVAAKKLAAALDTEEGALDAGKYRKIFEMDFMKKAVEQQREKAKVEAQSILKELRQMEMDEEDERAFDRGDQEAGQAAAASAVVADPALLSQASKHIDGLMSAQSAGMSMVGRGRQKKSLLQAASGPSAPVGQTATAAVSSSSKSKSSAKAAVMEVEEASVVPKGGSRILKSGPEVVKGKGKAVGSASTATMAPVAAPMLAAGAAEAPVAAKPAKKLKALVAQTSQDDLVETAFAAPDLESEYAAHKRGVIDGELGIDEKRNAVLSQVKSGWGDWAGPGNTGINPKTQEKRNRLIKIQEEAAEAKRRERADVKNKQLSNVMLSDRRIKTAAKYKIEEIPHPFTSREEYERSLQMPIGEEWNATNVVRQNTKPEIMLRAGRLIEPAKLEKKRTNPETSLSGKGSAKKQKR